VAAVVRTADGWQQDEPMRSLAGERGDGAVCRRSRPRHRRRGTRCAGVEPVETVRRWRSPGDGDRGCGLIAQHSRGRRRRGDSLQSKASNR